MPVPIASTLGILGDNLRKRRSALPLSRRVVTEWTRGLDLPRGGATVLYTGQMWQMVPAINAMSRQLGKYETRNSARLFGFARSMNRLVNLTPLLARTRRKDRVAYNERLRNIAHLLRAAGVEFGYLYEKDLYTGALAYDEGLDRVFVRHAEFVYRTLREQGVKRVITVDPHTTNMLRTVYPKLIPDFHLEVQSYLEVLYEHRPKSARRLGKEVAIHDSCIYARSEGVLEPPRRLLAEGGVTLVEPELSGALTFCCGGPLETLFPSKSSEVATRRIEQLSACSPNVVTACPLCLANLSRAAPEGVEVRDISDYLSDAYLPTGTRGPSGTAQPTRVSQPRRPAPADRVARPMAP
jgi:Cysteine-rich domain